MLNLTWSLNAVYRGKTKSIELSSVGISVVSLIMDIDSWIKYYPRFLWPLIPREILLAYHHKLTNIKS